MKLFEELIVLVDDEGRQIGTAPKLASHNANTPLHRAFSCFVFRGDGKFLLTQRALSKKTFPGVWSNSCCGHPGPGEETEASIRRRMKDELGMAVTDLAVALPHFRYRAEMNGIVENEICPVYLARTSDEPRPNPEEVESYEWVAWDDFVRRCEERPESLSPWAVLETAELEASGAVRQFIRR